MSKQFSEKGVRKDNPESQRVEIHWCATTFSNGKCELFCSMVSSMRKGGLTIGTQTEAGGVLYHFGKFFNVSESKMVLIG